MINPFNQDGTLDREKLEIAARQIHAEQDRAEMERALELSQAGYRAFTVDGTHTPHPFTKMVQVMSWFWEAPAIGPRKKGRVLKSTGQAWSHYQRSK